MKVKYRFLEGKIGAGEKGAILIAYTGFNGSDDELPDYVSIRQNKELQLEHHIENLSEKDIPKSVIWPESCKWSELYEIEIPNDNYDWTPDQLLSKRIEYYESLSGTNHRKTA